ncbi:MAG TPA: hypothetical protein VG326_06405 [Tepidisphaeraceae bacterium]|nr:hypothetical protein [Tepidisphaeraceae bacterium]
MSGHASSIKYELFQIYFSNCTTTEILENDIAHRADRRMPIGGKSGKIFVDRGGGGFHGDIVQPKIAYGNHCNLARRKGTDEKANERGK